MYTCLDFMRIVSFLTDTPDRLIGSGVSPRYFL